MKYICDSCEKYPCDDTEIKLMKYCPVYSPKPKPQTNADRIRSMTDEELAEMLNHAQGDGFLVGIGQRKVSAYGNWIEWLKREATP